MQTQGASNMWGSSLSGLDSNWALGGPYSSGANTSLLGYGSNSLSNNQGHMQSGASSIGDSLNSNPNGAQRGGWGAPGTIPPSQSTNRNITSSIGNMQGSLPVSGAQPNGPQISQSSSQSPGPNGGSCATTSQGNSAFGNGNNASYQKVASSGIGMNPPTSIMNSANGNAQTSDNLESPGWGVPSSVDNSRIVGSSNWGNPSGADWDQQSNTPMSQQSQSQIPSSSTSQFQTSNPTMGAQSNTIDQQRPSSWAQAAGKGLNLNNNPGAGASGNTPSPEELQRQAAMRIAIESHEGWGKKPIRQDTEWSIETSPKVSRKFSTASVLPEQPKGTNNMWNNNNGTAIWEANNKDNMSAWNSSGQVARAPGQPTGNWTPGQKPPEAGNGQWGAGGPGQAPGGPNKAMNSWGAPPEVSQHTGANWGGSTETGSWGGSASGAGSTWGGDGPRDSAGWGEGQRSAGGSMGGGSMGGSMGGGSMGGGSMGGSMVTDASTYWGEKPPTQQPPNWNTPGAGLGTSSGVGVPPTSAQQQAIGQNRGGKMGSGWGDPMGPRDPNIDDGTGLWASNNQQQVMRPDANAHLNNPLHYNARAAAGWGDAQNPNQWNQAIGKPKPPMPTQNPSQFGGVDELNWNLPKEDVWSEESMGGWDDADMGTWNDNAQQTNSTWNSATGWNRDKRNNVQDGASAMKFPSAMNQPPQMRSRLLQQLMDMGFKKDEAQHALITNNMNIQNAITDLYNRRSGLGSKKDTDNDGWMDGSKARMSGFMQDPSADDISDTQDNNSFVPNLNPMQNTPFNNAQSKIPNQFPFNNGPSLAPSSLNVNNPSINALQQKIIQKIQQQPPPPTPQSLNSITPPSQGPLGVGQMPAGQQTPTTQKQMVQQQILQQLRMAVTAGLISPQLLNQQLPTQVLVMLQQLLTHQQSLQTLINTKTMLQQPKVGLNPMVQRQQLEQVASRINYLKQQILLVQKNISQAQSSLLNKTSQSQPPHPQASGPESPSDTALQTELNNLTINTAQQPQSRLNQWKRSSPDKESDAGSNGSMNNGGQVHPDETSAAPTTSTPTTTSASTSDGNESDSGSLNKTVGSKPMASSNSTPNLRRFDELGLSQLGGDTTWSTTPASVSGSQNWPNTSTPNASTPGATSSSSDVSESLSSTAVSSAGHSSVLDSIPAIPEFVPGKPWQGISKSVEDDPHITPGSFARSLSVNIIKDDHLFTLNSKSSPNSDANNSSWPTKPTNPNLSSKPWSTGDSLGVQNNFSTSDIWGIPTKGGMSRPPPGLPSQKQGWNTMNRQHSWAGGAPPRLDGGSSWDTRSSPPSTSLVLKNLTPQIDGSTLRTLCMQHGPLNYFHLNLAHGQALVKYRTIDEAMKAQKSLNTCLLGNTTIVAEFVTEAEAMRFVEQQSAMSLTPSHWNQMGHSRPQNVSNKRPDMGMSSWGNTLPTVSSSQSSGGTWGAMGGGAGGGNTLWESDMDTTHNLLGNMLGENM